MVVGLVFWGVDFSAPPNPVGGCPEVFSPAMGCSEGTTPWVRGVPKGFAMGTRDLPHSQGPHHGVRVFSVLLGHSPWPRSLGLPCGPCCKPQMLAVAKVLPVALRRSPRPWSSPQGCHQAAFRGPEVLPMAFAGVFAVALRCLRW